MEQEKIYRSLPVKFTEDQVRQFSDDLAEQYAKRNALESEKKQVASDYKARIESADAILSQLARYVTQKQEFQQVECRIILDTPDFGKKTVVRCDTGDVAAVEVMTPQDRQYVINFTPAAEESKAEETVLSFGQSDDSGSSQEVAEEPAPAKRSHKKKEK